MYECMYVPGEYLNLSRAMFLQGDGARVRTGGAGGLVAANERAHTLNYRPGRQIEAANKSLEAAREIREVQSVGRTVFWWWWCEP